MNPIYKPQICNLKNLNNLFIELTAKSCNRRCKHCYIDFPYSKNVKDFISIDTIKEALIDTKSENIQCIYLTGAEPMTHPEFNAILRLCLKRTNVCICTNGSFINEKKARFLKRVEDESIYEIIFQLSIDHYDEIKSDDLRGRGTYRQTLNAIKSLIKYNFNPILCITDYYDEGKENLLNGFKTVCEKINFPASGNNFKINKFHNKTNNEIDFEENWQKLDCENSRILTTKGVYTCPFLANDHRGRSGCDFKNYTHKTILETDFCATCLKNKTQIFSIDFNEF
ncbi:radical SAM protein [bacterium]|nr:radical SAM protein [bacterium]